MAELPVVSVVGRPNVGKSTLFNRIIGRREAIVEERSGVTRDRKTLEAEWSGNSFLLVDTGGWMPSGTDLDEKVSAQSEKAMYDSDLLLMLVDATTGITEEEFEQLAEKQDACYHKVKSRYKVWPSAYASGALVQCRKKGAANWGNSKKK